VWFGSQANSFLLGDVMKILVTDVAAESGGALSVLKDYYERAKKNEDIEWYFVVSDQYIESTSNVHVIIDKMPKKSWIHRLVWEFVTLKKLIDDIKPDAVFSLQTITLLPGKFKLISHICQIIPFQDVKRFSYFKKDERIYAIYQNIMGLLIKHSINKSDAVICQSNTLKNAISSKMKGSNKKLYTIYPKIENNIQYREHNDVNRNVFFYPVSALSYKNHECLIEATNELVDEGENIEVIFTINPNDNSYSRKLFDLCKGYENVYKFIGYQDRTKVFDQMSKSVLVYPSLIETFGLPLLEGKINGSIILAPDLDYANEVLGHCSEVYYFNPFDSKDLKSKMKEILHGEPRTQNVESCYDLISDPSMLLNIIESVVNNNETV